MIAIADGSGEMEHMKDPTGWSELNCVSLHNAVLCANCEMISESSTQHCAVCGSCALLSLSRVLGGTVQSAEWPMGELYIAVASALRTPVSI